MDVSGVLSILGGGLLMGLVAWLVQRYGHRGRIEINGAVGASCGAVMSFFAMSLAFLLVQANTGLQDGRKNTYAESAALLEVYWSSAKLAPADRDKVRSAIIDYTSTVISVEWPEQVEKRQTSRLTQDKLNSVRHILTEIKPGNDTQQQALNDTTKATLDVFKERRDRRTRVSDGLSPLLIAALFSFASIALFYMLLIGWPKGLRYTIGLGVTGALFSFGLWLVVTMNHPYSGTIHVQPDAFVELLQRFKVLDRL